MTRFELTNNQRKYFGLIPVADNWNKQLLNNDVIIYFDKDKIVKVLNYGWGYLEYDTNINTKDRLIIIPKTSRGKEQRLTVPRLLKIKGCGIQFSGSFYGGGIHVYDNKRNVFFVKSFAEEGEIKSYKDIENWVTNYVSNVSENYFDWLNKELSLKKLKIQAREGNIIAFKIASGKYGFARILLDVFNTRQKADVIRPQLYWVHPRSLIVAPYAYYANTLEIDIDTLINKKNLPALYIFDLDVYRGEMPIIGYRPLSENDRQIPFPKTNSTFITIPYTKTDIDTFIAASN